MGRRLECGFCAHRFDVVSNAPRGTCPRCAARWSGDGRGLLDWDKPEVPLKPLKTVKKAEKLVGTYVTKYALTMGIIEVTSEMFDQESQGYLYLYFKYEGGLRTQVGPKDWFTDLPAAKAHAEVMRTAKIKSLQKQIEKLRKLSFK